LLSQLLGPLEGTSDYFIRILSKVCRERVKSFDVTEAAQQDFSRHTQEYMKAMVWTGTCRSWCELPLNPYIYFCNAKLGLSNSQERH